MKMSHKFTALLFTGMLFAAPAHAGWIKDKAREAYNSVEALPFVNTHVKIALDENARTTLPNFLWLETNYPRLNSEILQASVISAMGATALISENNSLAEIALSGLLSALGTAMAIKKFEEKHLLALVFYLLGQNGNQVAGFLNNARTTGLKPAWNLIFGRRTRSEIIALLVRNFMPILLTYTDLGSRINGNMNIFDTTATP